MSMVVGFNSPNGTLPSFSHSDGENGGAGEEERVDDAKQLSVVTLHHSPCRPMDVLLVELTSRGVEAFSHPLSV